MVIKIIEAVVFFFLSYGLGYYVGYKDGVEKMFEDAKKALEEAIRKFFKGGNDETH